MGMLSFERQQHVAQIIPPVIVIFLASLFIVIRPIARLSGDYAFLTLTIIYLYFFPAASSPIQLETAFLAFVGGTLSLAYCQLWLYFAVLSNDVGESEVTASNSGSMEETAGARAAVAMGLALLAYTSGWVRSSSPRLDNASRIALFHGVWMLTDASDIFVMSSSTFLPLFYVTLFASTLSILSTFLGSMILPYRRREVKDAFGEVLDGLGVEVGRQVGMVLRSEVRARGKTLVGEESDLRQEEHHPGACDRGALGVHAPSATTNTSATPTHVQTLTEPPVEGAEPIPRKRIDASLSELSELYTALRHSIVSLRISPERLRPILRVLQQRVGRNTVSRGGGTYIKSLESSAGESGPDRARTRTDSGSTTASETSSSSGSIGRALRVLEKDTRDALNGCKVAVADAYGWKIDEGEKRGGKGVVSYLIGIGGKRDRRRSTDIDLEGSAPSDDPESRGVPPISIPADLSVVADRLSGSIKSFQLDLVLWMERDIWGKDIWGSSSGLIHPMLKRPGRDRSPLGRLSKARTPSWTGDPRSLNSEKRSDGQGSRDGKVKMAAWLVAMLDLAKDISSLLDVTQQLCASSGRQGGVRGGRLWVPTLDSDWLGKRHHMSATSTHAELSMRQAEGGSGPLDCASSTLEDNEDAREREKLTADLEQASKFRNHSKMRAVAVATSTTGGARLWDRIRSPFLEWWNSESLLRGRIRLSRRLSRLRRSRHVRYGIKLALGVMLLSLPGLLPVGTAGRTWYADARGQWAVISYLYVLDLTTGTTFRIGVIRIIGTCATAIAGYVGWQISRGNVFGLVVMASLLNVPIVYFRLFTKYPVAGVVGGITYPPILFIAYLDDGSSSSVANVALLRAAEIALGVLAAFLINSLIFPYHARVKYYNVLAGTLDDIGSLYLAMSRQNLRPSLVYATYSETYLQQDRKIEKGLMQCRSLAVIQHMEISLLPKPHDLHGMLNQSLAEIYETMVEIRTLRGSIPRRETVLDVLSQRQDLVSSIYIVLFAVGHAARSFTPLPQFLPSPSDAVSRYSDAIELHMQQSRLTSRPPTPTTEQSPVMDEVKQLELAILYAYAEREALIQLCGQVDKLLAIATDLVGVQAFLNPKALSSLPEAPMA